MKYTSEFNEKAVKLVVDKGHSVPAVAHRFRVAEGVQNTRFKNYKKAHLLNFNAK